MLQTFTRQTPPHKQESQALIFKCSYYNGKNVVTKEHSPPIAGSRE